MPPDIDAVNRYFTDDYYGWGKTSLNFPNSKSPGTCLLPLPFLQTDFPTELFLFTQSICLPGSHWSCSSFNLSTFKPSQRFSTLYWENSNPLAGGSRLWIYLSHNTQLPFPWDKSVGRRNTALCPCHCLQREPLPCSIPQWHHFFSRALTICVFEKSFWWQCVGWVRTQGHQRQEVITLLWYYRRHVWRAWNRQWMKKRGCILKIWKGLGDGLVFSTTAFGGWEGRGRAYSFITHSHKGRRVPSTGQMHLKKCLKSPSQQKVWQGELYLCFFSTSGVATSTSKEPWRCCYHHSGQYDVPLTTYSLQLLNICFKWGWVGKGKKRNKE